MGGGPFHTISINYGDSSVQSYTVTAYGDANTVIALATIHKVLDGRQGEQGNPGTDANLLPNTEYRDRWLRDSIHVHDSIFMFMKGDTVFRDRWHIEYRNKLVYDTTYINRTDSICVPYPIEKQLSRWESIKMELGGWAFGTVIGLALIMAGWLIYRLRRRYK